MILSGFILLPAVVFIQRTIRVCPGALHIQIVLCPGSHIDGKEYPDQEITVLRDGKILAYDEIA